MLKILLIDNDHVEREILSYHLTSAGYCNFEIEQVTKCSTAIKRMLSFRYDLVLLDNALEDCISAEFSVPFIKENLGDAPLVIISNNINVSHLKNPDILGVDYIVDKTDLARFVIRLMPLFPKHNELAGGHHQSY